MTRHHIIGASSAMRRAMRRRDHAYLGSKRDTRKSGGHPTDWILVGLLLGLLVVGIVGWLR